MKILIVGSNQIFSIENYYVKYLREFGVEVELLPVNAIFQNYYNKSPINKLAFRTGLSNIYKKINQLFIEKVEAYKAQVIWVFKGMEIFPESLQVLKKKQIQLVNYNPDNPFIFSGRGSGNENISKSIALYDLHLTYNLEIQKRLRYDLNLPTAMLPFGFDLAEHVFRKAQGEEEILKACFVGNPDKQRASFIRNLAEANIKIDVYGNFWNKFLTHENVKVHEVVLGDDLWVILRRYRVQLNLMRPHNLDSHNMRTFEVPGIGGITVAPNTTEHRLFFENGKEAFFFNDLEECAQTIKNIIKLPTQDALRIRQSARERSIISGYDYKSRTKSALNSIENLLR